MTPKVFIKTIGVTSTRNIKSVFSTLVVSEVEFTTLNLSGRNSEDLAYIITAQEQNIILTAIANKFLTHIIIINFISLSGVYSKSI